jgi:hypothetical protein
MDKATSHVEGKSTGPEKQEKNGDDEEHANPSRLTPKAVVCPAQSVLSHGPD